ncbi:hypothetical protein ACRALDRAFT_207368 [Sodiomyces alcalophilus JCM 7366]|uniref:uncharacterized protein n=1 Tax=Sodiomyces alcalophilus JCM 7366 TaxID=591952 RepID=UPI0039B5E100
MLCKRVLVFSARISNGTREHKANKWSYDAMVNPAVSTCLKLPWRCILCRVASLRSPTRIPTRDATPNLHHHHYENPSTFCIITSNPFYLDLNQYSTYLRYDLPFFTLR